MANHDALEHQPMTEQSTTTMEPTDLVPTSDEWLIFVEFSVSTMTWFLDFKTIVDHGSDGTLQSAAVEKQQSAVVVKQTTRASDVQYTNDRFK